MSAHISLTLVVGYGVAKGKSRFYLPLAILGHTLEDIFPALYQRGAVSMMAAEVWLLAWTVLLAVWAAKLYKRSSVFALQIPKARLQAVEGAPLADILLHQQMLRPAFLGSLDNLVKIKITLAHRGHDRVPSVDGHIL